MNHEILLGHVFNPHHMEEMDAADAIGQVGFPGEGPFMILYLKKGINGQIACANFETYSCPSAIGCGSWLTQWVQGKTAEEVSVITPGDLMIALGGLPLGKEHCAQIAVDALRIAVKDWQDCCE